MASTTSSSQVVFALLLLVLCNPIPFQPLYNHYAISFPFAAMYFFFLPFPHALRLPHSLCCYSFSHFLSLSCLFLSLDFRFLKRDWEGYNSQSRTHSLSNYSVHQTAHLTKSTLVISVHFTFFSNSFSLKTQHQLIAKKMTLLSPI